MASGGLSAKTGPAAMAIAIVKTETNNEFMKSSLGGRIVAAPDEGNGRTGAGDFPRAGTTALPPRARQENRRLSENASRGAIGTVGIRCQAPGHSEESGLNVARQECGQLRQRRRHQNADAARHAAATCGPMTGIMTGCLAVVMRRRHVCRIVRGTRGIVMMAMSHGGRSRRGMMGRLAKQHADCRKTLGRQGDEQQPEKCHFVEVAHAAASIRQVS